MCSSDLYDSHLHVRSSTHSSSDRTDNDRGSSSSLQGTYFVDGQTGLLAPGGEFESLAAHVLRLAELPEERHEMGCAGRARAESLFTERRMHESYKKCYNEMLGG